MVKTRPGREAFFLKVENHGKCCDTSNQKQISLREETWMLFGSTERGEKLGETSATGGPLAM